MPKIPRAILESEEEVLLFLTKRGLLKQYLKAKQYILTGWNGGLDFKERNPQGSNIWSFRINVQFRAFGYFDEEGDFIVTRIDNHS